MKLCTVPGCTRRNYSYGLCEACALRKKCRGTTDYATLEERTEVSRKGGIASQAARRARLGACH